MNRPPFIPNWRVPLAPEDDTTSHKPNVVVAIQLVGYGYQIDCYVNGEHMGTECADFADTHNIATLEAHFADSILEAIRAAKKGL